jgi:Tol biopolymer transport system component
MRSPFLVCLLALGLAPSAAPAGGKAPTVEQSISLRRPESPRISPDGSHVAYVVREANWKENAFEAQIWVAAAETGERFQLTRSKKSSREPRWSPDGKRLAFLSDRDGKNQVYLISLKGGEALPLTASETGVTAFEWSPDGRQIAFTAADPESKARKERKENTATSWSWKRTTPTPTCGAWRYRRTRPARRARRPG